MTINEALAIMLIRIKKSGTQQNETQREGYSAENNSTE
jgi:hypothetical protein